jgi:DNA-binding NtrC family response regulator
VRIIAATNRLPHHAVAAGKLREDLLYRLNVFPIELPPLRDRLSDVPLLAEHFLQGIIEQEGHARRFTPAALAQLGTWHWPGNVRELRNAVQRSYVMAQGDVIDEQWLPRADGSAAGASAPLPPAAVDRRLPPRRCPPPRHRRQRRRLRPRPRPSRARASRCPSAPRWPRPNAR